MTARRVALIDLLKTRRPDIRDPGERIAAGSVLVDSAVITNPKSMVALTQRLTVVPTRGLRGAEKMRFALNHFGVDVAGRVCVDIGACTGGFSATMLEFGARRIYAVEVGHGQLLGSLRQDPRVVNFERTSFRDLAEGAIDEPVDLIVSDVMPTPLAEVIPAVTTALEITDRCELVALVKPMFELRRHELPTDDDQLDAAVRQATVAAQAAGWTNLASVRSPVTGARGAIEFFISGRRGVRAK